MRKVIEKPAVAIPAANNPEPLSPRGLRVKEAAAYLGVTPFFIRDAVWKSVLPAAKLGRRLIIAKEDLDRFFDEQKRRCAA